MSYRALGLVVIAASLGCPGGKPKPAGPHDPIVIGPDAAVDDLPIVEQPAPALRLPTTATAHGYQARLVIDPTQDGFTGVIDIDLEHDGSTPIWLHGEHLTITSAWLALPDGDRQMLTATPLEPDLIGLRDAEGLALIGGRMGLHLEYDGRFETTDAVGAFVQSAGADRYVFTQFEPLAARRVFPCFDEPSSKVPWQLTLDVPTGNVAIGNAPVASDEPLAEGWRRVVFEPTSPLPTYLIAFAVGPFELVDAGTTPGGAPIRIAAFRGEAAKAAWAAEISSKLTAALEDWFGTPYPYAKLDMVPIPSTTWFGAMENAGLITYRSDIMLFDPKAATENQRNTYAWYAGHEIAHQWFGDLVTMTWWNDLWLNEAFATWMEDKVVAVVMPASVRPSDLITRRSAALNVDGLVSARMIRQPIEVRTDIDSAFDGITYSKGASVLSMFEHWVGPETFQAGVRGYLAAHEHGNATSEDFLIAVDDATELDLAPAFRTFLEQSGAPLVTAELTCPSGGKPFVTLRQDRWLPRGSTAPAGPTPRWQLPICVAYGAKKGRAEACTLLVDESIELPLEGVCPRWIMPNHGGVGYYRMGLAEDALADLLTAGWKELTPAERILVAGDVSAMVDRGDVGLGTALDLVPRMLRDGSREATSMATKLIYSAIGVVSEASRPTLRAWVRSVLGKRARRLGWLPRKGEKAGLEVEHLRSSLVPLVASFGRDPVLLDAAVKLAKKWRTLPEGSRVPILQAAVVRKPALAAELLAALPVAKDPLEASAMVSALSMIEDPETAKQTLAVLLDERVDLKEAMWLMLGLTSEKVQPVSEAFLKDNFEVLLPRLPEATVAYLVHVLTASCDASKRADIETWARANLEQRVGGPRTIATALESLDLCVAEKAALGPELDEWLARR